MINYQVSVLMARRIIDSFLVKTIDEPKRRHNNKRVIGLKFLPRAHSLKSYYSSLYKLFPDFFYNREKFAEIVCREMRLVALIYLVKTAFGGKIP